MSTLSKPKKQFTALDLLTDQHTKVDVLFAKLDSDSVTRETKQALFVELADNLAAHATMEEKMFYPAVRAKATKDMLLESTEEHLAIKRVLADLLVTSVDEERFAAKLKVLKEEVSHHAHEEEEAKLFPKVRTLMSSVELEALGGEMLMLFEQLMATQPRKSVPNETRKPARI